MLTILLNRLTRRNRYIGRHRAGTVALPATPTEPDVAED